MKAGRGHFRRGDGMQRTTASEEGLASPGSRESLKEGRAHGQESSSEEVTAGCRGSPRPEGSAEFRFSPEAWGIQLYGD